jgi:hypothetical protein
MRFGCYPSSPRGQGTASSFYRPRGGGLQSGRAGLSATRGNVAYNAVELIVFLTNLASGGRRGGSCTRPGVASRVVVPELLLGRRPYADSRVRLMEAWRPHRGRRGDGAAVPGMAAQWWGWLHKAEGDRGDAFRWPDFTAPSQADAGQVVVPLSRIPPSSSEGATWKRYGSGRHSVME